MSEERTVVIVQQSRSVTCYPQLTEQTFVFECDRGRDYWIGAGQDFFARWSAPVAGRRVILRCCALLECEIACHNRSTVQFIHKKQDQGSTTGLLLAKHTFHFQFGQDCHPRNFATELDLARDRLNKISAQPDTIPEITGVEATIVFCGPERSPNPLLRVYPGDQIKPITVVQQRTQVITGRVVPR